MRGRRSINVNKRGVDKTTANVLNQLDHLLNDAFQTDQFISNFVIFNIARSIFVFTHVFLQLQEYRSNSEVLQFCICDQGRKLPKTAMSLCTNSYHRRAIKLP